MRSNRFESSIIEDLTISISRNIEGYKFVHKIDDPGILSAIECNVDMALSNLITLDSVQLNLLSEAELGNLVERNILSTVRQNNSRLYFKESNDIFIVVNEHDHVKIVSKGNELFEMFQRADFLDTEMSKILRWAYFTKYGFLTRSAHLLGTGIECSAKIFVPATIKTDNFKRISDTLSRYNLIAKSDIDSGHQIASYNYIISNKTSIGKSEVEFLNDMQHALDEIISIEADERYYLLKGNVAMLNDDIARSLATFSNARVLSYQEFKREVSILKLAYSLNLIDINEIELEELSKSVDSLNLSSDNDIDNLNENIRRAEIVRAFMKKRLRR